MAERGDGATRCHLQDPQAVARGVGISISTAMHYEVQKLLQRYGRLGADIR